MSPALNKIALEGNESLPADVSAVIALWDDLLAREKNAVGQELHAGVAQVLTALRLNIALFIRQQQANPDLVAKANWMLTMTDQSLQTVGNLLNHLQSPSLGQSLKTNLEQLIWDFSQRHALKCNLTFHNDCDGFDQQHSQTVLGILQEALTNIVRHAGAENAGILCSQGVDGIEITVLDDGCGFDVADAYNSPGLGLQAMRWRAMSIGGRLAINCKQSSGTRLTLFLPCRE